MKNSKFLLLFFPLLFSCHPDDSSGSGASGSGNTRKPHSKISGQDGANTANSYDAAGVLQNEIAEAFINSGDTSGTIEATLKKTLAAGTALPLFGALRGDDYLQPSETRIGFLTDGMPGRLDNAIAFSGLSSFGKVRMQNFTESLLHYRGEKASYGTVYKFITDFEDSIIGNEAFTDSDQKILLTTASLCRHAFYFASVHKKRKPRDRDWDISVGHISLAVDFAEKNAASAAVACACAALLENY